MRARPRDGDPRAVRRLGAVGRHAIRRGDPEPCRPSSAAAAPTPPELPRGGRTLFPDYRLVGFCGTPGAPALGPLLDHPAEEGRQAALLRGPVRRTSRKILPVFELIAVVVQAGGGADGKYRARVDDAVVDEYLAAARGRPRASCSSTSSPVSPTFSPR